MCNQQKDRVRALITEFNSKGTKQVDIDRFFGQLDELGAVDQESYAMLKWEDLQNCGLPTLLARQACNVFRGPQLLNEAPTMVMSRAEAATGQVPIKRMRIRDLLAVCVASDKEDPYTMELMKRPGLSDKRFVVYTDDTMSALDFAATMALYEDLDVGSESELYQDGSTVRPVYKLGEKPMKLRDEHPMFPGEYLRPNGFSVAGLNWASIPLNIRQLVRVATTDTGELDGKDEHDVFSYCGHASHGDAQIATRCPKAILALRKLEMANQAPTLKTVVHAATVAKAKPNNPFANRTT